jgi:hypothetical protein
MNKIYEPVELEQTPALGWLRYSLGQGETLSLTTLEIIEQSEGRSYAILPGDLEPKLNLDFNGILGLDGGPANRAMARMLKKAGARGAACVVMEDDLREKGGTNPNRKGALLTAFVGQRVIHWAELGADADIDAAVTALNLGASGYPLNAFVTSANEAELGLIDGTEVSSDIVSAISGSLMAVIVGAYDGVSFVIWEPS